MEEKTFSSQHHKWLMLQFTLIHEIAEEVYRGYQGGNEINLYNCNLLYTEEAIIGWIKESTSWEVAIRIYDNFTASEGWDIIEEANSEFGESYLRNLTPTQITNFRKELR